MPEFTLAELNVIRCLLVVAVMPQVEPLVRAKLAMEEGYLGGTGLQTAHASLDRKVMDAISRHPDSPK